MSYGDGVRIERATNGYTISMRDPKIEAANRKRSLSDSKVDVPWVDPQRTYVFSDIDAVLTFIKANLDKALPKDDYSSAFDMMADEEDD